MALTPGRRRGRSNFSVINQRRLASNFRHARTFCDTHRRLNCLKLRRRGGGRRRRRFCEFSTSPELLRRRHVGWVGQLVNGSLDGEDFGAAEPNFSRFKFRNSGFRPRFNFSNRALLVEVFLRLLRSINEVRHRHSGNERIPDFVDARVRSFGPKFLFVISKLSHEAGEETKQDIRVLVLLFLHGFVMAGSLN